MVRCADCGFLACRDKKELIEVDESPRIRWTLSVIPLCSRLAADLVGETGMVGDKVEESAITNTLTKDRDCSAFRQWIPGFSPKEHKEMMHEADIRQQQQAQKELDANREDRRKLWDRVFAVFMMALGFALGLISRW